jgi:putative ABC transport system ATP-binding protein
MISIENLRVIFSRGTPDENVALNDINLNVERGDFITVIGSNGAGKTTLLNAIAGSVASAYTATSGKIMINGRNVTGDAEHRRAKYIGRIFQNPLLGTAGKMSLADNMMLTLKKGYKGLRISLNMKMKENFAEELKVLEMGLDERLNDNVELFSGGQRQALTLLMTVMSKPELLLLDEHTAALDPRNAEMVMRLTLRFASEYNLTVIMITHNMAHALEYGNRLLMMDGGNVILDIGQSEKKKLTREDVVRRFHEIKKTEIDSDKILLS